MRPLTILFIIILFGAGLVGTGPAQAETWYVTDSLDITLRTGPQLDRKITAMLKSGQAMEMLEKGEEWSQVRLSSGKEGWVLNRFIQAELPLKVQLAILQEKHDELLANAAEPLKKLKEVSAENTRLRRSLAEINHDFGELQKSYQDLRKTTADARRIKEERDQLSKEVQTKSSETRRLKTALAAAEKKNTLWWFMAGAGVLLFGYILGFAVRPKRKRPSLY